jgi:para-aminobenzoate synthetase / 4-amino-4-deoxychorismate lyase
MKLEDLNKIENFIILDNFNSISNNQLLFKDPIDILYTNEFNELEEVFTKIDYYLKNNYYVVGYITYEAGLNFLKKKFEFNKSKDLLCNFGIFKNYTDLNIFNTSDNIDKKINLEDFSINIDKFEYINSINLLKEKISIGEIYQINYTFELKFQLSNTLLEIYTNIRKNFRTNFSALLKFNNKEILSFSPESFFYLKDSNIKVKPMKGTGINQEISEIFSEKNKAENLMIVDLLRNDLGQISIPGSVKINNLLNKEIYGNIEQLTSEINSKLNPNINFYEIFQSIFPSGSITGAPKEKAMEWIEKLEERNRGVYTGSIGFFSPEGEANFNVAIRTIEKEQNYFKMGIGSGIVYDSNPELEWEECHQKAFFLYKSFNFHLFESILFKNNIFYYQNNHLERLKKSALLLFGHFEFSTIINILKSYSKNDNITFKVKIKYYNDKTFEIQEFPISNKVKNIQKIKISDLKVNSKNFLLQHKTSFRKIYDNEYSNIKSKYIDSIFSNEKNEITEGCISNIFILINNEYLTPPIISGLLPGIFRNKLLNKFPQIFKEKKVSIEDLKKAKKIFICNSVRGIIRVQLHEN